MHIVSITALLLFFLCGCSSLPNKMVGQFDSHRGDFVILEKDGYLYWSPLSKTRDKLAFVGIVAPERKDATIVSLIVPSSSRFLNSKITFSNDYTHLSVDWGEMIGGVGKNRSTEYDREK